MSRQRVADRGAHRVETAAGRFVNGGRRRLDLERVVPALPVRLADGSTGCGPCVGS